MLTLFAVCIFASLQSLLAGMMTKGLRDCLKVAAGLAVCLCLAALLRGGMTALGDLPDLAGEYAADGGEGTVATGALIGDTVKALEEEIAAKIAAETGIKPQTVRIEYTTDDSGSAVTLKRAVIEPEPQGEAVGALRTLFAEWFGADAAQALLG